MKLSRKRPAQESESDKSKKTGQTKNLQILFKIDFGLQRKGEREGAAQNNCRRKRGRNQVLKIEFSRHKYLYKIRNFNLTISEILIDITSTIMSLL